MELFQSVLPLAIALSVVVAAVVQLVKITVKVKKNFLPLIGIGAGMLLGTLAYKFTDLDIVSRLWAGGFAGLGATGLFELVQNRPGTTKEK